MICVPFLGYSVGQVPTLTLANQGIEFIQLSCYILDKAFNSRGALLLKTGNFKVIFKIPGGHIAMFSTRA